MNILEGVPIKETYSNEFRKYIARFFLMPLIIRWRNVDDLIVSPTSATSTIIPCQKGHPDGTYTGLERVLDVHYSLLPKNNTNFKKAYTHTCIYLIVIHYVKSGGVFDRTVTLRIFLFSRLHGSQLSHGFSLTRIQSWEATKRFPSHNVCVCARTC